MKDDHLTSFNFVDEDEGDTASPSEQKILTETVNPNQLALEQLAETGSFDLREVEMAAFGKLLEALPLAAMLVDATGHIVFANQAFKLFCVGQEGPGVSFATLFPSPTRSKQALSVMRRVFDTRKTQIFHSTLKAGKRLIWGRMHLRSVRAIGERLVLCLVEDLSQEREKLALTRKHHAELKKRQEQLRQSNERLQIAYEIQQQLLSTSATAIFSVDSEQQVTDINEQFTFLTGFTREEVVGKPCHIFSGELCRTKCPLLGLQPGQRVLRYECQLRTKDGTILSVLKNVAAIPDGKGGTKAGLESFIDVSELIEARQKAEMANRAKGEFLANMGHELRTPLNAIIGFADLLIGQTSGALNDEQLGFMNYILNGGQRLLQIINDILDLVKLQSGKVDLCLQTVRIHSMLESSLTMIKEKALKHGLKISLQIQNDLKDAEIQLDQACFKQVMFILLSNAMKFTPDGGAIRVDAISNEGNLVVAVADTGVGLKPGDREKMFNTFEQVDSSSVRRFGGIGVGLSLAQSLVRLHGGSIWANSGGVGEGCKVTFTIPKKPLTSEPPFPENSPRLSEHLEGTKISNVITRERLQPTVLIVEGDPISMELAATLLEEAGHVVARASTAGQALEKAREVLPDLILVDPHLPDVDGARVTSLLRTEPHLSQVPFVALTDHWTADSLVVGSTAAYVGHIVKPISRKTFAEQVASIAAAFSDEGPRNADSHRDRRNPK
jgi:PAS domain S-box-containing protein